MAPAHTKEIGMTDIRFSEGPLDGLTYTVDDASKGVLAADPDTELAWLYASGDGVNFELRIDGDADPASGARPFDEDKAIAAVEYGYVVLAVPGDDATQEEIEAEVDLDFDQDEPAELARTLVAKTSANPSPTRISAPLWGLWTGFKAYEKSALLGGIYANKPGYHNGRDGVRSTDYSVEEIANDRAGSAHLSSAIDLTLPAAKMVTYSKRLEAAMRARDKRLFIGGAPILREYIGTINNKDVRCYMLTGGRAQGVGADSGLDYGRDKSHLWHVHISIIRKFAGSADAMERVLSILKGEAYNAWAKRHGISTTPVVKPAPPKPSKPATGLPSYKNGSRQLKAGMKGTDVRFVQTWIGTKHCGKADGNAGPLFTAGVKWYQDMRGLKADGVVGPKTWAAMGVH
jgi:hypothetical protein